MVHGKIPQLSLWKGVYLGNGAEATSINLQEAYGGNFPKDPEIGGEKLSILAFQHTVQERCENSTSRCTKLSYTVINGRGWNSATNHSSESGYSEHSIQF